MRSGCSARSGGRRAGPSTSAPADDSAGLSTRVRAYFAGDIEILGEVPVRAGGTPFQRTVWAALREIPPGRTTSYGQLAARLGRPGASRAVGLANGANPVAIAVPCHRVIGADGTLTGYGGGLERKRWLLEHERASLAAAGRSMTLLLTLQTGGEHGTALPPPGRWPSKDIPGIAEPCAATFSMRASASTPAFAVRDR